MTDRQRETAGDLIEQHEGQAAFLASQVSGMKGPLTPLRKRTMERVALHRQTASFLRRMSK